MKKIIKKITTTFMTLIFALSLIVTPTFAEGTINNSSIQPEIGNLIIHKYLMDDVSGAGIPNDGNQITIPTDAKPLSGIDFNLYKVSTTDDGKYPVNGEYTLNSNTNPSTLTDKDGNVFALTVATVPSVTTDDNGIATANNLPRGIYLVVEQADGRVASPVAPFLVSVPMTNSTGNGWIPDVHVYPKNESVIIEKTPSDTSIVVGQTVTWDIKVSVPTGIGEYKKFDVIDQLDSALDYTNGSVVVTGLASKDADTGTVIDTSDYTISYENRTLTVSFSEAGRKAMETYKYISVKFDTTVNSTILDREDNIIENTPQLDFTNKFDENKKPSGDKTEIHTSDIKIEKVDKNNTEIKLIGAEFKIASSEANAKSGKYLKKDANGKVIDYGEDGYDTATDWVETSGDKGIATFKGLEDYTETNGVKTYRSYWLVETKSPDGYNLLNAPIEVKFTAENSIKENAYTVSIAVKNSKGFTLPATGGTGTVLFSVAGTILIGLSAMLIITSKKKVNTK